MSASVTPLNFQPPEVPEDQARAGYYALLARLFYAGPDAQLLESIVESDEMVAAIKANNVPVEYIIFPDEGHGFRKKENQIKGYGEVLVFLEKYLKQ